MTPPEIIESLRKAYGPPPLVPWASVKWRVQGEPGSDNRVLVVPYLSAPTVADLLNQWLTPFGWQDDYQLIDANSMWCKILVWHPVLEDWIAKRDVGTASNYEPAKGLVSDAFKRCGMRKWGVGNNVYKLPNLRIQSYRTYSKDGKTQVYLLDQAKDEIAHYLKQRGLQDAAEQTTVDVVGTPEPAQPPPSQPPAQQQPPSQPPAASAQQSTPQSASAPQQQSGLLPHQKTISTLIGELTPDEGAKLRAWWVDEAKLPIVKQGGAEFPDLASLTEEQAHQIGAKIDQISKDAPNQAA